MIRCWTGLRRRTGSRRARPRWSKRRSNGCGGCVRPARRLRRRSTWRSRPCPRRSPHLALNRLWKLGPPEPPNRYCRRHAGELVHLDVKKLGRFNRPGHRVRGRGPGRRTFRAGSEPVHVCVDDATRLAYVEVHEHAGMTTAIAVRWFQRAQFPHPVQTRDADEHRAHGPDRHVERRRDLRARPTQPPPPFDLRFDLRGVRVGRRCSAEDRSSIVSPASWRANQRYTVRCEQPAASAASSTVQPSRRTCSHTSVRWNGLSRALPCSSIGLLEVRVARTLKSPGASPDERTWDLHLDQQDRKHPRIVLLAISVVLIRCTSTFFRRSALPGGARGRRFGVCRASPTTQRGA